MELLSPVAPGWGGTLLVGLLHSIEIALGATCLGLMIGTAGAFGKLYGGPVTRDLLAVYTTVVRAVPELVLILLLYYAGTDLINQVLFSSLREYNLAYGISRKLLDSLHKEIVIMHPGPINRGVEMDSDVADSKQSIILQQVENGVAVRMAVLYLLSNRGAQPAS